MMPPADRTETASPAYACVMGSSSAADGDYRPSGAAAEPRLRVRPPGARLVGGLSTRRGDLPRRTSMRWSLRSYGPAPTSVPNSAQLLGRRPPGWSRARRITVLGGEVVFEVCLRRSVDGTRTSHARRSPCGPGQAFKLNVVSCVDGFLRCRLTALRCARDVAGRIRKNPAPGLHGLRSTRIARPGCHSIATGGEFARKAHDVELEISGV